MSAHRQLWRELDARAFYTRADLVLDIATAVLIAAVFICLFMTEFGLWS